MCVYIYFKGKMSERWVETERGLPAAQMPSIARAGSGQSRKAQNLSRSPTWTAGTQTFGLSSTVSKIH